MPIEFNCHVCGKLLRTSDDKAGRTARCPGCGESLTVPEADPWADDDGGDPYGREDEYDDYQADDEYAVSSPTRPAPARPGRTKTCPMCGEQIQATAVRCRYCGAEVRTRRSPRPRGHLKPHRGGLILTFALLGWFVCIFFSVAAWVMGSADLNEMQAGRMDPSGEGTTKAGKIIAMIQVILLGAVIVFYCLIMMIAGVAGGL